MASQEITERLTEELKAIASQAEDLLKGKSGDLAEKTKEIRNRLASVLETAEETVESLETQTAVGMKAADRIVRDHPYQSIGVALGLGLVLGLMLKRH